MKTQREDYSLFFELIRCSLDNQRVLSRTPTEKDWEELYNIARKQSLVGICIAGIQNLRNNEQVPPKAVLIKWYGQSERLRSVNIMVNKQCVALQDTLRKHGFDSCILKGQGINAIYDSNLRNLRQSGDIDVWVAGGMKKILPFLNQHYGKVPYDYINAHIPFFKNTEVEIHWRCSSMTNLYLNFKLQKWLHNHEHELLCSQQQLSSGQTIIVPTDKFNLFYILLHAYNHMFAEGLGLRQLIDYYFVLKTVGSDSEIKQEVLSTIRLFHMQKFTSAVMWIMLNIFGMEKKYLLCPADKREGQFILNEIMRGGNFGHYDNRRKSLHNHKIQSFVNSTLHNFYLFSHYPSKVFWAPIWLMWHFLWKRTIGK